MYSFIISLIIAHLAQFVKGFQTFSQKFFVKFSYFIKKNKVVQIGDTISFAEAEM